MNENAQRLAALLIRNFNDAELNRDTRQPLYDGQGARLARGTAAKKLGAGDVMFIPPGPDYPHQIINSSDAPLKYLSVSTREYPEICEYPDSGKYLAMAPDADSRGFDAIQRKDNTLDCWDGEP